MANPLARIPGLGGYVAAEEQQQAQQEGQLRQLGAALSLRQIIDKQRAEAALQAEISKLGPNPDHDALLNTLAKHANSGADTLKVLELQSRERERREARADRALQMAQTLDVRQQQLDLQREAFLQRTQDQAARDQFERDYKTKSLELQQANAGLNAELKRMGLEIQKQGQQIQLQRVDQAAAERRDKAVTAFANELQQNKLPGLSASLSTANDLLRQYENKDIPGLGVIEGSSKVPNFVRSEEANRNRSAIQAVSNDLLNLFSGLAVTLPEAERRELEEMRGGNFTSQDFKNAWPRIVNRYNSVVGNVKAGANAEVLREYQSRPGAMRLDPLVPAFNVKRIKDDAEYNALPSGTPFIDPEGKRRVKP